MLQQNIQFNINGTITVGKEFLKSNINGNNFPKDIVDIPESYILSTNCSYPDEPQKPSLENSKTENPDSTTSNQVNLKNHL